MDELVFILLQLLAAAFIIGGKNLQQSIFPIEIVS